MALEINALRKEGVFPTLFFSQKMKASTFNISSYGFISCEAGAAQVLQCNHCSLGISIAREYLI